MKIKTIKIRGFRGFNVEQEITLDAGIVLVHGLNGSGKSSLAEAFEWLFFDDISRRRLSPCPGEYTAGVYLRNLSYIGPQNPFVEVLLVDDTGIETRIRKELITEKESKSFVNGTEVVDFSSVFPGLNSHHSPVLAQIEISALVNTEQKDRWEQLSRILGREELTLLRTQIMELRSTKKDAEYKRDEQLFNGICRELEIEDLPNEFDEAFEVQDSSTLQKIVEDKMIDKALGLTGTIEEKIRAIISKISGTELGKRIADLAPKNQSVIDEKLSVLSKNFGGLVNLGEKASKGKFSPAQVSFLSHGLQIAKTPHCPFCDKDTLTDTRLSELGQALEVDKESILSKQEFDQALRESDGTLGSLSSHLGEAIPDMKELRTISQKLGEANLNELSGKVKQFVETSEGKVRGLSAQLKVLYGGLCRAIEQKFFHKNEADVSAAQFAVEACLKGITSGLVEINTEWQKLRDEILLQFPKVSAEKQGSEIRKWILVEKAISLLKNKTKFIRKYKLIEVTTEAIRKKLEAFEKAELENLLVQHSQEIKAYYERLNPGESISFGKIEVRDGARRQAKLVAYDASGKEINPVTIFSEAHINSLSLSIYFPQRVDRNPIWKTILLDDPVQSMDSSHAHSLIGILREKAKDKQVIVLTHSKEFSDDVAASFLYDDFLHYEFYDADEAGPKVKINLGKTPECLEFVEANRNGTSMQRDQASNALRKALEAVIGEILLKKGMTITQVRGMTKDGFTRLFDQLERIVTVDRGDIGILRGLLNQGQQGSHSWTVRDATPTGLAQGIKDIKIVYSKYIV